MSENSHVNKVLLAFLVGTAAGAVAGLLLAPRTGKETRKRLSRWIGDLEDKGEDLIEKGLENVKRFSWEKRKPIDSATSLRTNTVGLLN